MRTIASYNIKGGVGKTTVAVNLAHAAVSAGHRTLLWDIDEQGGAGAMLGYVCATDARGVRRSYRLDDHIAPSAWAGLDLLPADRLRHFLDRHDRPNHLRKLLDRIAGNYDRVVLDCPPTLGHMAEQVFEAADLIIVPMVPSTLSMTAYAQLATYAQARPGATPALLPLFTMVDRRRRLHRAAVAAHPERLVIPYASVVEQMAVHGQPIAVTAPSSAAAQALAALWAAVEAQSPT